MCEFKILVAEPGKKEVLVKEDISFLPVQDDGAVVLRGLGIREKIDTAIISEVNTYADEGATAKLFKVAIIGDFMKFLKSLENGTYTPELEKTWTEFVNSGKRLLEKLKK
jgi:hypothetical protein